MALAGLKKQLNKANQYMSEKMGATEGTKLAADYGEMEQKTDGVIELVDDLLNRTKEYLQPNPATRAKLMLSSKVVQTKTHAYPQPEGTLGECMLKASRRLGDNSVYADCLNEAGEALKQMAEVKYALEDTVKQNFLEPLTHLQNKDIRDVQFHRKKLEGRRLDFDCKRRRAAGTFATPNEIKAAEDKFEESLNLASMGMFNLLQNETELISQLAALSESLYEYHSQSATILESLTQRLIEQKELAAKKPPEEFVPRKLSELLQYSSTDDMVATAAAVRQQQANGAAPSSSFYPVSQSSNNSTTAHLIHGKGARPHAAVPPPPPRSHSYGHTSAAGSPVQPPTTLQLAKAENNGSRSQNASPLPSPVRSPARSPVARSPCASALYDFDAENPGELGFKEGEIVLLLQKIDDNWYQGSLNGKTGMFPVSYVQVLVPLN